MPGVKPRYLILSVQYIWRAVRALVVVWLLYLDGSTGSTSQVSCMDSIPGDCRSLFMYFRLCRLINPPLFGN